MEHGLIKNTCYGNADTCNMILRRKVLHLKRLFAGYRWNQPDMISRMENFNESLFMAYTHKGMTWVIDNKNSNITGFSMP